MSGKTLLAAGVSAVLTYAALWLALIAKWSWLDLADTWVLRRFHDVTADHPGWIMFWQVVSDVLSPTGFRILGLAGIVVALIRRNFGVAIFLAFTIGATGLVTVTAKALSDRPRPDTALIVEASTAFPSGHAVGVTVGVLTVIALLWPGLRPSRRRPVIAVGAALIVLVGLARVALNVHHPSDVVAGWALGFGYFLLCMALMRPFLPNDVLRPQDSELPPV